MTPGLVAKQAWWVGTPHESYGGAPGQVGPRVFQREVMAALWSGGSSGHHQKPPRSCLGSEEFCHKDRPLPQDEGLHPGWSTWGRQPEAQRSQVSLIKNRCSSIRKCVSIVQKGGLSTLVGQVLRSRAWSPVRVTRGSAATL